MRVRSALDNLRKLIGSSGCKEYLSSTVLSVSSGKEWDAAGFLGGGGGTPSGISSMVWEVAFRFLDA